MLKGVDNCRVFMNTIHEAALHETLNGVRLSWYDVTYLEAQPIAKYGMSRQSR